MTLFDITSSSAPGAHPDAAVVDLPQWRLVRIEVVNWGTFHGFHGVDIATKGHLFTGASGSGKSSLLDAIAAVLTPKRVITFNAAAQETSGHRSDRTWVTYVRGAWSKEADELEDRTVATYLRPRATWSGILLRFEGGGSTPVTLVRLFHLRGSSTDPSDVKEMNVITRGADELMTFAPYANAGIDKRRLVADIDPVIATTTGKHGGYFQRLQRELGIKNETALQLLHRTQAAKNLGTLDTLFRRFMLDEPPTFTRADAAVDQFAELRDAYRHVVDLRRQRDALSLVTAAADSYDTAQVKVARLADLAVAVPTFASRLTLDLSKMALIDAQTELGTAGAAVTRAQARLSAAEEQQEAARSRMHDLGGGDLAAHRGRIDDAEAARDAVAQRAARLAQRLEAVGLPMADTEGSHTDLIELAREELHEEAPPPLPHELQDRLSKARSRVETLAAELEALERHRSNIDARLLRVRADICRQLDLPDRLLPFAGELISVKPEYSSWTGAIERVLAPLATALLVRDDELAAVREYVARTHLGVNLTLDAVPSMSQPPQPARDDRSLVYRVAVAQGPFTDYLNRRLSDEFDIACVESPTELDEVSRGVTISGLVKRASRRYVKADRYRVDDRSKWVLGGEIGPKRDELEMLLASARTEHGELKTQVDASQRERDEKILRRNILSELVELPFAEIDVVGAEARIAQLRAAYELLAAPDSDLGRASAAFEAARAEVQSLHTDVRDAQGREVLARNQCATIQYRIDEIGESDLPELAEQIVADLDERFRAARRIITFDQVDAVLVKVQAGLHAEITAAQTVASDGEAAFAAHAMAFTRQWPDVVTNANLTVDIADRDGYRAVRDDIVARGLPEHEANFRNLLDSRSRESVTFLREDLRTALRQIQNRIGPVNDSLQRSRFDRDRWLHIRVKPRQTQEVKDFMNQLGQIVDGTWDDEDFTAAERRFTVLETVMQRLGSSERPDREWRNRVLDTREHVTFIAEEIDQHGAVQSVHDSSAGLSGGQRQKLVVFCLAAALRYQLADVDAAYPNYAAVVLDEAFDKADADYTRMAMDVFVRFGFQMILATPGKLLQTLEPYIGAVTVVTNPDRKASQLANVVY